MSPVTQISSKVSAHLALVLLFTVLAATVVAHSAPANLEARGDNIARPVIRATPFVPRLGKRNNGQVSLHQLLCANYGLDCGRLMEELNESGRGNEDPTLRLVNALIRSVAARDAAALPAAQVDAGEDQMDLIEMVAQQLKREPRSEDAEGGTKRLAFTPRIG